MFLCVSGSVLAMDMNDEQRANFAAMLRWTRRRRFGDSKKAAYTAAKVNSATWDRAEQGETIKAQSVAKIVSNLFNEAEGDWTKLLSPDHPDRLRVEGRLIVGASPQDDPDYVSAPGPKVEGGDSDSAVLEAIERMRQDVQAMEQRLSERLDRLEGPGA